jgi:hypothetical protein
VKITSLPATPPLLPASMPAPPLLPVPPLLPPPLLLLLLPAPLLPDPELDAPPELLDPPLVPLPLLDPDPPAPPSGPAAPSCPGEAPPSAGGLDSAPPHATATLHTSTVPSPTLVPVPMPGLCNRLGGAAVSVASPPARRSSSRIARAIVASGSRVTEMELDAVEKAVRLELPAPYRAFLLKSNGGRAEPEAVTFFAVDATPKIAPPMVMGGNGADIPPETIGMASLDIARRPGVDDDDQANGVVKQPTDLRAEHDRVKARIPNGSLPTAVVKL